MRARSHTVGLLVVLASAFLAQCSVLNPAVTPGENRSVSFEPGVPNFVMDAVPFVEEETSGIDVAVSAPRATFVFARRDSGYVAPVEVLVRVLDRRGRRTVREQTWADTLASDSFEETQRFEPWAWNERMEIAPGSYVVEVAVESLESGGRSTRRQRVEVIDPRATEPAVFGIRMTVREGDRTIPFAGMQLPADFDSLKAGVELANPTSGMEIEMVLVRHPRDTSVAAAPFYFSPTGRMLARVGIGYDESEVVQRTARRLDDPVEHLSVLFSLPPLEAGAYEVRVSLRQGEHAVGNERREFVVMSADFPRITTLDQMIDALAYIARRHELEHIREPDDAAERRARFDSFWGSLIPNRQEATQVMQAYYSRIEEANVLFSTYKEGWKTDRGMVYVVMGPPVYREVEPRREIWRYSYATNMVPDVIFEREFVGDLHPAFDNFVLQRYPEIEARWERAVERWRDGRTI